MQYVQLGRTGLRVSRICLGTMTYGSPSWRPWVLDEKVARPFLKRALELGITFFDTADMYSLGASEEILGRALKEYARRDEVIIGTKVYWPMSDKPNDRGLSRSHVLQAAEASLRRLQTDYIDLYQIHRWDATTPIDETLRALDDLVRAGKVRYVGASSMYAYQFARALYTSESHGYERFVSMQNHYNLVYREEEREMIPLCREEGIGIIPWSPLARGFLAGNRSRGSKGETLRAREDTYAHQLYTLEADQKIVDRVAGIAEQHGCTRAQVALAWMLGKEYVTAPIIGATQLQHLGDAVAALDIVLEQREVQQLEELYIPHRVLGHA